MRVEETSYKERLSIPAEVIGFTILATIVGVAAAVATGLCLSQFHVGDLKSVSTGLIVGSVSLLLTLASRNISISDRIRGLSQEVRTVLLEWGPSDDTYERVNELKRQLELFRNRWGLNQIALGAQFATTPLVVAGVVLAGETGDKETLGTGCVWVLSVAVFLFSGGAMATIIDIWLARGTLRTELESAVRQASRSRLRLDCRNTNATIHFNRLFNEIWLRDGLGRFDQSKDGDSTITCSNELVFRYYGLHHEQFYFFVNGLIPRRIYGQWLGFLRDHLDCKPAGGSKTFKEFFRMFLDGERDSLFNEHMSRVVATKAPIPRVLDELEEAVSQLIISEAEKAPRVKTSGA